MKSTRLNFEKLRNTRDLGGMIGADGRRIKSGMLIRSGQLFEASENDKRKISELVNIVFDLRTDDEVSEQPDPKIDGVTFIHRSVLDSLTAGISREDSTDALALDVLGRDPEKALEYMKDIYRSFPVSDQAIGAYRAFIDALLGNPEKAVLWHCTAGKDRAGFASVLTEHILGVSWDDIREDYLYTNECIVKDVEFLKDTFLTDENCSEQAVTYLFSAQEEYLDSLITTIYEKYGSFDGFIREALGVTDEKIKMLRDKYLEEVN